MIGASIASIAASRLATLLYLEGAPAEANTAARTALTLATDVRSARLTATYGYWPAPPEPHPATHSHKRFGTRPTSSRSP